MAPSSMWACTWKAVRPLAAYIGHAMRRFDGGEDESGTSGKCQPFNELEFFVHRKTFFCWVDAAYQRRFDHYEHSVTTVSVSVTSPAGCAVTYNVQRWKKGLKRGVAMGAAWMFRLLKPHCYSILTICSTVLHKYDLPQSGCAVQSACSFD